MRADILIRNGKFFDAEAGKFRVADVAVQGKKIAATGDLKDWSGVIDFDASGCLVLPGLIDFHIHLFTDASDEGVPADLALLPYGVTSAVEGGSAGVTTYQAFRKLNLAHSLVSIKANLNVSSIGMLHPRLFENARVENYEEERILELVQEYRDELFGLKMRYSLDVDPEMQIEALDRSLELAEKAGLPLVVHITNPPLDMAEIARRLRPGDVFCHCFQEKGNSILDAGGRVKSAVWDAKRRGVLFDASNGTNNYCHDVAIGALREGFLPDIISTDGSHVFHSYFKPRCFALPYILSKYLALGMSLEDVLQRATVNMARLAGWSTRGALNAGCAADVAIFKLVEKDMEFADYRNATVRGHELLTPEMTIKDGTIVFRQLTNC